MCGGDGMNQNLTASTTGPRSYGEARIEESIATRILHEAGGEQIEAIVIEMPQPRALEWDKLYTWAEAEPHLQERYSCREREANLPTFYAWTATKVLFAISDDGGTRFTASVPRHPIAERPEPV